MGNVHGNQSRRTGTTVSKKKLRRSKSSSAGCYRLCSKPIGLLDESPDDSKNFYISYKSNRETLKHRVPQSEYISRKQIGSMLFEHTIDEDNSVASPSSSSPISKSVAVSPETITDCKSRRHS